MVICESDSEVLSGAKSLSHKSLAVAGDRQSMLKNIDDDNGSAVSLHAAPAPRNAAQNNF